MNDPRRVTLYHAPHTRSSGTLLLLEELGAPYDLEPIDLKAGEQRGAAYRAVNPMGKVPALRHGETLVTEQVAIFLYLADLFSESGLAPALADPQRGDYLRWMVYFAACFEPAMLDRALTREPAPRQMCPYGDFDSVVETLTQRLAIGPFILGERFSAADVLWGTALVWSTRTGVMPASPAIDAYLGRLRGRPALARVKAIDAELAASLTAKAGA